MTIAPLLSILVPTYAYPEGFERILRALDPLPTDVELIVFDDTPGTEIAEVAGRWTAKMPGLSYRHNPSIVGHPLGAANNWNALLETAHGRYFLLMHHDEMPLGADFCTRLRAVLTDAPAPDVVLLDVVILDAALRPLRHHLPGWVRWHVIRRAPGYLFRRNVIGPTGALVVRRECFPRFDPSLRWLVDAELYVRLCRLHPRWRHVDGLEIGSIRRSDGTITAALKDDLRRIDVAERKALRQRYPGDRLWLGSAIGMPLRALEWTLWAAFRVAQRGLRLGATFKRTAGDDPG